jgi:hypothetical protein
VSKNKFRANRKRVTLVYRRAEFIQVVVICFVVILCCAGIVMSGKNSVGGTKPALLGPVPMPTVPTPGNPSKEYIYVGNRLVATEEPGPSAAPSNLVAVVWCQVHLSWTDNSTNETGFRSSISEVERLFSMGLDAVVYPGSTGIVQLDESGQRYTDSDAAELRSHEVPAIHKRLGNASMIASIADEVLRYIGKDSVLLSKVLYSGSHSGDTIALGDLDRLDSDIHRIREKSTANLSSDLESFLEDMSELIRRARVEQNPIVFI